MVSFTLYGPALRIFLSYILMMRSRKAGRVFESDKIVCWNNVKLQQIAIRHNRRRVKALIDRKVPTIVCKEFLSTTKRCMANIVCGNNAKGTPAYSS